MKTLVTVIIAIGLVASASSAFAQPAPGGRAGGPPTNPHGEESGCDVDHIHPGRRAEATQVEEADDARVLRINECQRPRVEVYFGDAAFNEAILHNKTLKSYLNSQGVQPDDVVGVQVRLGRLIVYAKIG